MMQRPNRLADWFEQAKEALDVADAIVWGRIQAGEWFSPEESRLANAALRHIEASKESLNKVADIERMGLVQVAPQQMVRPAASAPSGTPARDHIHKWVASGNDGHVCEIPGCGMFVDNGKPLPRDTTQ